MRWTVRKSVIGGVVVVVVAGVVTTAALTLSGHDGKTDTGLAPPPNTAEVTRRTLVDTTTQAGRLGYGTPYVVNGRVAGTLTKLPAVGEVISRGEPLYEVDDRPVIVMYGAVPAYRVLKSGDEGPDVEQLEKNLAALGYVGFDVDDDFTVNTAAAVKQWQKALGLTQTGTVDLGSVVFVAGQVRIDSLAAAKGEVAAIGSAVLSCTGTAKAVTVELDIDQQRLAAKGAKVVVVLPNGRHISGRITDVSTVIQPASGDQEATTKVDVVVDLPGKKAQKAASPYALAAVNVDFTVGKRSNVLTVPVAALLALQEGGFGVEVVKGGTSTYLSVKTGLFADGRVEISGTGITAGTRVGMPS